MSCNKESHVNKWVCHTEKQNNENRGSISGWMGNKESSLPGIITLTNDTDYSCHIKAMELT